jgi:hypothetical protein
MTDESDQTPPPYEPPDSGELDALQQAYEAKLRGIKTLPELDMRIAAIDEGLRDRPAAEAAWWIDQLLRGSLWGKSPAFDAMMACSQWLIRKRLDDDYELLKNIFTAAHADDRKAVLAILRDPPPHKALPKGKQLPEPDLPTGDDITLGQRRQIARGHDRKMLSRILLDPSPIVVEKLLDNPNLREQDVLEITTRRPNTPDILLKVALHKRWYARREVRYSLVMNPYNGTGCSLRLLPTIGIHKLRKVRNSTHLHPTLIEVAQLLVDLREERTAPWRV